MLRNPMVENSLKHGLAPKLEAVASVFFAPPSNNERAPEIDICHQRRGIVREKMPACQVEAWIGPQQRRERLRVLYGGRFSTRHRKA